MIQKELQRQGRFDVRFRPDTPDKIRDLVAERGHLVFTEAKVDPRKFGKGDLSDPGLDAEMLGMSAFTGRVDRKVQGRASEDTPMLLSGPHVTAWLGDADGRGEIITVQKDYVNTPWNTFVTDILPASLTAGSLTASPGNLDAEYFGMTPKAALDHAAELKGAEYRVNDDGSVDSGLASELYVTTPTTLIVRRTIGWDPSINARPAAGMESTVDAGRWVSELHIAGTAQAAGGSADIIIGTADLTDIAKANPYKDLQGNADATAVLVNDAVTFADQGNTRAQALLGKESEVRTTVSLPLDDFEIEGEFEVGDTVWVFDPPLLVDPANTQRYGAGYVTPVAIRVFSTSYPVLEEMGVYYRDLDGAYVDLSPYVEWEEGSAQITVGDPKSSPFSFNDSVTGTLVGAITNPPNAITIPDVPVHANTPWSTSSYQNADGVTLAQIIVEWTEPLNTDGSSVTDGSHYLVRYRRSGETDYQYVAVQWGTDRLLLQELAVGTTYEISVAAFDLAGNTSGYATDTSVTTSNDTVPPSQPAAPTTVAGSPLKVQVTHYLGKNTGGTFNLEPDVARLDVYAATSPGFTPTKGASEVQTLYNDSTTGTFDLTFDGQTATSIPYNETAGNLETTLEGLSNIFNVTVSGAGTSGDPWTITFLNPDGPVPEITTNDTGMDGTSTIATVTEGGANSNFVGVIPVSPGNLTLEIPVIGTFDVPDTAQRYVVVIAVDTAGNESTASPEATETAILIDTVHIGDATITNAKIQDVSASKITAGTITSQVITIAGGASGYIQSSDYVAGSAGWRIGDGGTIEISNGVFRGFVKVGGSFDNLVQNPGFESDVIDGPLDPHQYIPGGGTFSSAGGSPRSGARAARFDVDSQSGVADIRFNGPEAGKEWHAECAEGDEFYLEFYARGADSTPYPQVQAILRWVDESETPVSTTAGTAVTLTTAYGIVSVTGTAPANAAYIVASCRFLTGGDSGAAALVDDVYFRRVVADPMIGSVSADKIIAGTVNTGEIFIASTLSLSGSGILRTANTGARLEITQSEADRVTFRDSGGTIKGRLGLALGLTGAGSADMQLQGIDGLYLQATGTNAPAQLASSSGTAKLVSFSGPDTFVTCLDPATTTGQHDSVDIGGVFLVSSRGTLGTGNDFVSVQADQLDHAHYSFKGNTAIGMGREGSNQLTMYANAFRVRQTDTTEELFLDGTQFRVANVSNLTTTNAANVWVNSTTTPGQMRRVTSSLRYKTKVKAWDRKSADGALIDGVLSLTPISFTGMEDQPTKPGAKNPTKRVPLPYRQLGLAAEEVAEKLPWAAVYDQDGNPDSIDWRAVMTALLLEVKSLRSDVDALVR